MATKKITIPVGFQFDDVTGELANVRKSLSNIKINTNLGDSYSKAFSRAEKEIEKLQQRAARGFSSQSDIDAYSTGLNNVLNALERIQTLSGKIKFSDLNLNGEQLRQWNSLKNSLQNATQILNNFKRNQINSLFQNNEQFASTMKNIVGLTEQTYTNYGELTSKINSTTKALQNQEAQQQKNLELAQAQLATYQGAKKNGGIESIASQYGHQNKDGKWSFNANQGKENSAGRTALLDYGKQAGVFSDDDINRMNSANVSLQTIVNTFNNQLSSAIQKAKQDIQDYQTALEQNKQKFEAVKAAMEQLDSALNNGSIQKAQKAYNDAKVALDNFEQSTTNAAQGQAQMRAAMATSTNQLKSYKAELASFRSQLDTMQSADNLFNSLTSSVKQLVGFGAVLTQVRRGIQLAVSQIQELDSAMNGISVVTNMSTAELWGQIDTYMAIAKQYGVTTEGTYQVSQLYYQMGLDTSSVMELTTETLKMAKIANLDYASATDYMTTAMNGFQMAASDAGRIVDVYSELAGIAATDTSELAVAMSKTAAIANSAGMSFEATSAMLTQMIESTREAPEALGTSLKTVIARMQEMKSNPTQLIEVDGEAASLNKMDTALSSVGIKLKDASGQFRNLDEVIFELSKIWDTLDRNTQRWIANTAAGSRQQSRFISLLSDSERLQELYTAALDSEDAALVQYSKSLDSMESKLNQLSTSFQQFYMQIFNGETLKAAVEYLTQFVDKLNEVGPVGAIAIVGSLISALGSIGMAMSTKIAAAYKTSKEYLDSRKAEIQAIGDSWWDGFVASFVPKVQTATNQAVQILQNAQAQMQGGASIPTTTGTPHRRSGRNDGKARGTGTITEGIEQAAKGAEKVASKWDKAAIAANKLAPIVSVLSTVLFSVADASNKASVALAAVASVAQFGVGIAQLYSGDPMGLLTIFTSVNQFLGLIEYANERLARLKKDAESANIARAESKSNLTTLDSAYKKYIRLRDAQYESNEAYNEWIKYNQQIISDYPQLATTYDSQGNLIADLAGKYDVLRESANLAYQAQKKSSQAADVEVASQPLYKFSAAGFANADNKDISEFLSDIGVATSQEEARNILFSKILPGNYTYDQFKELWDSQYKGLSFDEASTNNSWLFQDPVLYYGKQIEEMLNSSNPQESWDKLKNNFQGLSLDEVLNLWNQYSQILQSGSQILYKDASTNIEETVDALGEAYNETQKQLLRDFLQNQLDTLYTAGQLTTDIFTSQYDVSAIDETVNDAIDAQFGENGSLVNYTEKELKKLQDFKAGLATHSLKDYKELDQDTKEILKDIYGITSEDFTGPIELYINRIAQIPEAVEKGLTDNAGEFIDERIYQSLSNLPVAFLSTYYESLSQLFQQTNLGDNKDKVIDDYINLFSQLSSLDLDYSTLSSLLTDSDFTTRSGVLAFSDALVKAGIDLKESGIDLNETASLIPISMADAEQGLTSLQTSMASAADIIKNLQGSDSEKKLAAYNTLSTLGIDTDKISALAMGEDLTGKITQEVYDKYISQQKANLEAIIDSLYNAEGTTDEQRAYLDAISAMIAAFDKEVAEAAGTRATNIVSLVLSQMEDVLGGKAPTLSRNDISALQTYAPKMVEMLEQTGSNTWTLKAGITTKQWADAISDLAESVNEPGIELVQTLKTRSQEEWDKAVRDADLENFITPMLEAISDGGEITFDEDIYKFLSEQLGKNVVDKMLDPDALTAFTSLYDFDGTVKEWLDMVQKIIDKLFPDYHDDFIKWREKNEYGLNQSREYNRAQEKMDKVHQANETPEAMADIVLKMKNMEASTDDATEAVRRFNLEYTDLVQLANGKWGLSTAGLKKFGLDAQIVSVEDYRDEIAKLKEELLSAQKSGIKGSQEEANRIKTLIALREQELKLLNEKNQLVSQNADDYNTLLDAPENYAKNILSYADELKKAAKTGYIEISTLSNVINNLGPASNTVKALSKQLNVPLLKDGTANIVALTDALYSTKKLATIDGKPMVQIGAAMANMLQGAAKLDLKDVAQQNIDMLDGMIATLEALQALEDVDIDGGIKMDMLTEATFTTTDGKSFTSFNDLWKTFKETAEDDSDLWIDFAAHVTADIQTEEGQRQFIDWLLSDQALQQRLGIKSKTLNEDLILAINTVVTDDMSTTEAEQAILDFLEKKKRETQNVANNNPSTIDSTTKVNTTLEDGTITDGRKIAEEMSDSAMDEDYKRKRASTDAGTIQQELVIHSNVEEVQKAVDELAKDRTSTLTIVKKVEEATEPTFIEPTTSYDENSIPVIQQTPTPEQQKLAQETNDALEETSSGVSAIVEWVKGLPQRGAGAQAVAQPLMPPNKASTSVASTQTPSPTATPTPKQEKGTESTSTITLEVDDKSAQQEVDNFFKENDGKVISFKAEADTKQTIASADEATQEIEGQDPTVNIDGDPADALAETQYAVGVIDNSNGTINVGADASAVYEAVNDLRNNLSGVNIDVNLIPTVAARGKKGGKGGGQVYTARASGGGVPKTEQSLVGELGPELVVHDNSYRIVGQYGAEFVKLNRGDVVFNASDTARLLQNKSGVRGTALVNGTGPAYGSGLSGAIGALKEARAAWSSILNSVPDMLKKGSGGGGGGGGGGDESEKEYLMQLEKWFNWLRRIEELENRITVLRAKRENLKDGKQYADSIYEENAYLKKQSELYAGLIEEQKAYRKQLQNDYLKNYSKYFYFIGDAIQINSDAILADTKNNEELGDKIQDLIDDYKDVTEQITDNTEKLEENKTQMDENIKALRDKYIDMENEILDALKNMYQQEIDEKQKALDKMKEADDDYLNALKKNLDKEKDLREKSKTQEEKQTLQRKIALLSRDTSGANAKEIADLRKQLRDMQEEQYFTDREDAITSAEDATQAQQNTLQKEIDNLTEANDIKLENMRLYWAEVEDIINQGSENILTFLQSYSDSYMEMSKVQQEDYTSTWKQTIDAALEYAKDMQKQFNEIIAEITETMNSGLGNTTGGLENGSSNNQKGSGNDYGDLRGSGNDSDKPDKKLTNSVLLENFKKFYELQIRSLQAAKDRANADLAEEQEIKRGTSKYNSKNNKTVIKKTTGGKRTIDRTFSKYASGGYVDYTGLAWVDGTPSKPETFLSNADTNLLANFLKAAHSLELGLSSSSSVRNSTISGAPTVNVDSVEINITQAELKDDADLNKLSQDLSQKFLMDIARQSGNISLSRR
jgi:TP901 family phage tail tape measure protein